MRFKVSLSAVSSTDQTATLQTEDGSATAPDDYSTTSATVTIPAGAKTGTFTVPIIPDRIDEGDETFTVDVTSSSAPVARGTATGTIVDDDTSNNT